MISRLIRLFPLVVLLVPGLSCLDATQITFDISTDVPCDKIAATAITVGVEGETEKGQPQPPFMTCGGDGMVHAIGTWAVTPKASVEVVASARVTMAIGDGLDVIADCVPSKDYKGCVVARRRVGFVVHRSLVVPITLYLACKDVSCDANTTCNRAGKCVTSEIDTSKCVNNVCTEVVTRAGDGLPCLNDEAPPLFCVGETPWCTRDADVKRCTADPVPTAISFQCRNDADCGPNLHCVSGGVQVPGRCVVVVQPDNTVLCTPGVPSAYCPPPQTCSIDAGPGLFSCSAPDAGFDAGIPDAGPPVHTGFLYVADNLVSSIASYRVAWSTESITIDAGTSFTIGLGSNIRNIAATPDKKYLVVYDTERVAVLNRGQTSGGLTVASAYIPTTRTKQGRVLVHPNGRFVYVAGDCSGTQNVATLVLNPTTAALSDLDGGMGYSCEGTIGTPDGLALSSDGRFLYQAGTGAEAAQVDLDSGVTVPVSPRVLLRSTSGEVGLMRQGSVLLVTERGAIGGVSAIPVNATTGALEDAGVRRASGPLGASELALHPNGSRAYMVATNYNPPTGVTPANELWTIDVQADATLNTLVATDFGTPVADVLVLPDGAWVVASLPDADELAISINDPSGTPDAGWLRIPHVGNKPGAMFFVQNN